jgi:hypothetical protein
MSEQHATSLAVAGVLVLLAGATGQPPARETEINRFTLFGAGQGRYTAPVVTSGRILTLFGSDRIDLTHVSMAGVTEMRASVFAGRLEIRVPKGLEVRVNGAPVFGKYVDRTQHPEAESPVLIVKGHAVLGAVSVRN